jgi:uridine kinase
MLGGSNLLLLLLDAFDYELMVQTLHDLKQGKRVQIPIYDFTTHKR